MTTKAHDKVGMTNSELSRLYTPAAQSRRPDYGIVPPEIGYADHRKSTFSHGLQAYRNSLTSAPQDFMVSCTDTADA
ncbi:hypothetical protein PHYBLDRAFT_153111 [Phycomyces blakesleeanus NRRL 1555(-)]|uniref:Uncharacterized protein n=1 Tax=Phycomyces blakesleeanus (strain ATCC 8743b / DSM 1359 / FGSC 10004 / NBRC 33097 / NRRL 1555) TaxID=763407 RepID=A0A167JEU4_PHYB8|nr:hypothetical protein PHYBLDRAFT_153111 [Phycomyces blakesleeanus NRRL 1555(-)]OAD65857.1 hypothetical protein PHYBLDRAFT_153111 [Phycomyces blakesleeanus NRRL 1555(-)]|eukprot:XP_018283897.1 hypothetical protein PHYBLDRAFT_153111 [Phycomyces blakesleeanus NRRL 1555(-)]